MTHSLSQSAETDIKVLFAENEKEFSEMLSKHRQLEQSLKDLEVDMFKKQGSLETLKKLIDANKE